MNAHILQAVAMVASFVIFARVEPVLNLMGPACRVMTRIAFWLLAVGSAALVLAITQGYRPSLGTAAALAGTALLLVAERRVRGLLRRDERVLRERRGRL